MKSGLDPRDAIHVATMLKYNILTIISEDHDFDKIDDVERLGFEEALEEFR